MDNNQESNIFTRLKLRIQEIASHEDDHIGKGLVGEFDGVAEKDIVKKRSFKSVLKKFFWFAVLIVLVGFLCYVLWRVTK